MTGFSGCTYPGASYVTGGKVAQTRTIQKKGILKLTLEERKSLAIYVYVSIIRYPRSAYFNDESNPVKTFVGYASMMKQPYVLERRAINTEGMLLYYCDRSIVASAAQSGSQYNRTLEALKIISFQVGDENGPLFLGALPNAFDYPLCPIDTIKFRLIGDAAVQVQLVNMEFFNPPDSNIIQRESNAPEKPAVQNRPSSGEYPPFNFSPAYDGLNDNGDTFVQEFPTPTASWIRGAGLNSQNCTALPNRGTYRYEGYATLQQVQVGGCQGLRVFLNGVDQGEGQTYFGDAIVFYTEPPP